MSLDLSAPPTDAIPGEEAAHTPKITGKRSRSCNSKAKPTKKKKSTRKTRK